MLGIVTSYHCMQFQRKLMNQAWENGKKLVFGPYFDPLAQILAPKSFLVEFTCTRCWTLLQAIITCKFKEN